MVYICTRNNTGIKRGISIPAAPPVAFRHLPPSVRLARLCKIKSNRIARVFRKWKRGQCFIYRGKDKNNLKTPQIFARKNALRIIASKLQPCKMQIFANPILQQNPKLAKIPKIQTILRFSFVRLRNVMYICST